MRTPISCAVALLIASSAIAQDWTPDPNDTSLLVWLSADSGFEVTTELVEDVPITTVSWMSQATASSAAGIGGIVFSQVNSGYAPSAGPSTFDPAGFDSIVFDGTDYLTSPYIVPNAETGVWDLDPANPLVGQQTAFIVYRDVSTRSYATPLGTFYNGKGSYHGNVDDSSVFSSYADPATTRGAIYRNGTRVDDSDPGTAEYGPARPDQWVIDAYVATSGLSQALTTIGADSCNNMGAVNLSANRGITGEIAEILLFNRELDARSWTGSDPTFPPNTGCRPRIRGLRRRGNWRTPSSISPMPRAPATGPTVTDTVRRSPPPTWRMNRPPPR